MMVLLSKPARMGSGALAALFILTGPPAALAATPVDADTGEVVSTAHPNAAPPNGATASQPIQTTVDDPRMTGPDAAPDRKVHGMLEVGVGTNGYRHVAGAVTAPIGADGAGGEVSVAIDQSQGGRR